MYSGQRINKKNLMISNAMMARINKIDYLLENGYTLKTYFGGFINYFVDKNGNIIYENLLRRRKELPGFSWIGFIFPEFIAVKARHWNFFLFLGIANFLFHAGCLIIDMANPNLSYIFDFALGYFYGWIAPYVRRRSVNNLDKEISFRKALLLSLILFYIVQMLPSVILESAYPGFL